MRGYNVMLHGQTVNLHMIWIELGTMVIFKALLESFRASRVWATTVLSGSADTGTSGLNITFNSTSVPVARIWRGLEGLGLKINIFKRLAA